MKTVEIFDEDGKVVSSFKEGVGDVVKIGESKRNARVLRVDFINRIGRFYNVPFVIWEWTGEEKKILVPEPDPKPVKPATTSTEDKKVS